MAELIPSLGHIYVDANGRRVVPFALEMNVVQFAPQYTQDPDFAAGAVFRATFKDFLTTYERDVEHFDAAAFTSEADVEYADDGAGFVVTLETDEDPDVTFEVTGGDDAALFFVEADTDLVFQSAPDFDSPEDADEDNVYEVEVSATDNDGNVTVLAMTVTVTDAS